MMLIESRMSSIAGRTYVPGPTSRASPATAALIAICVSPYIMPVVELTMVLAGTARPVAGSITSGTFPTQAAWSVEAVNKTIMVMVSLTMLI